MGQVTASGLPWRGREGRQGRGGEADLQPLPDFTLPRPPARTTRITRCGQKRGRLKQRTKRQGF